MIRPVTYKEILDAPNAEDIIREYAEECLVPDAQPQRNMYEAMERAGILYCFGDYDQDVLIGFISIIASIMPHNGKKIANIESIFALSSKRKNGVGDRLLEEAERFASEAKCVALTYGPRIGSRLDKVLSRRRGYEATHTVHTRWL